MIDIALLTVAGRAWQRATKTKGLRAKPMSSVINDVLILSKYVKLDTLEGEEPVDPRSMFCIGVAGDAWQQNQEDVLRKYELVGIDTAGWLSFDPRPSAYIECSQIGPTEAAPYDSIQLGLQARFGKTIGKLSNIQLAEVGDWICRDPANTTDTWIVRRHIFDNTYQLHQ